MTVLKRIVPFVILFGLLALLYRELFYSSQTALPSTLVGEIVPDFNLPEINAYSRFSKHDLPHRVLLLNVWATWCYACSLEHPMLMKIQQQYHVPIYSFVYKDDPETVRTWLNKKGNPYVRIGNDSNGDAAIDFGVYGTPETFVVNPEGKIVYRFVGAIDQKAWDEVLYPIIRQYGDTSG